MPFLVLKYYFEPIRKEGAQWYPFVRFYQMDTHEKRQSGGMLSVSHSNSTARPQPPLKVCVH